ncbi:MAG: Tn3 family transposase [Aestuariivita sp.]|nr:Tn3 family transposase [Aestuariivita sp.]
MSVLFFKQLFYLVIAAIKFWNTLYMNKAVDHLKKTGENFDPQLLPFTSALG